ncbi:MAG: PKD domain-containing protein [Tannerella sp.]|jgi:PKD repeat protein|nr:PKD domain-containing protein [Tannerella sp.]
MKPFTISKKTKMFLLLAVLFLGIEATAQVSEKGVPASFAFEGSIDLRAARLPFVAPIQFDVAQLREEDRVSEQNHLPLRTSVIIPVDLDVRNSGEWSTLPNGQQVWTLTIEAPDAIATSLYYDDFFIPEGGKLFIYNEDHSHVIGAYTHRTNPNTEGTFATEFVAGDKITLEYNAPAPPATSGDREFVARPALPRLKISGIGYGYNYLKIRKVKKPGEVETRIGESESCEVNINCPEGADWQDEKKGVARSLTPIGGYVFLCSGTLVNNTRQDLTPFFLTASHCFYDGATTLNSAEWNQILYYFHDESPTCETAMPLNIKTVVGAQMLVEVRLNGGSDGVLLKLNMATVPLDWDLYFNGWDRSNTGATGGVGIHHPAGDVKKISTFSSTATSATANMNTGEVGDAWAHWRVYFDETVSGWGQTEGGSSGSPLFNQNGLVVGTLTGGNASCNNLTGYSIYGKLWYHWDHPNQATASGVDLTKMMKDYLDPDNTGVTTLNGTYTANNEATADFTASATNIYILESVTYTDHSVGANTWTWTFEGGTPSTWSGKTPPPIAYNAAGTFTTTLVINSGTGPQETQTETINVTLKGTPAPPVANFGLPNLVFSEGFDSSPLPGWTVQNSPVHVSPNQWALGNLTPGPVFSDIDPSSVASAIIVWHANYADTWLITAGDYSIVDGSSIEFYVEYDGYYLDAATMNFLVSDDGGATWTQKWTAGTTVINTRPMSWTKYSIDLSAYDGSNLKFAWQYVGADGNAMALDGIRFNGLLTQTTLYVGDFLTPIDRSTGTPVLWDWTFNGATPVTASGEAPTVQYMTAGVYDVTLKVTNTEGTDTKTVTAAVTVLDKLPVVDFTAASLGYTMRDNYGPYITPHQEVDFTDLTQNYPLSWDWTLGGTPANSTGQNPQNVLYDASDTYDVILNATNSAGTQSKTVTDFVKAGYDDPTRIWNLMPGENIGAYTFDYGAVFGSNNAGISMFSERFDAPLTAGYVSKVDFKCFKTALTAIGNLTVAIFSDDNGVPGTQLGATGTLSINSIPTSANLTTGLAYSTVTFPTPILVTGAFHVRFSGLPANVTAGVRFASAISRGALAKNTAYLFAGGWGAASQFFFDLNTSLDVVPYFEYTSDLTTVFEAEPAYTLKANGNLYIPTGAGLNFRSLSTGLAPNEWDWAFTGGNPATSAEENPQNVVYDTDGTYNVSLTAKNEEGVTSSLTKADYVKAIYNQYNPIWNVLPGEVATSIWNWSATQYIFGHNLYGITDYSERFEAPVTAGKISGVVIQFNRTAAPSGTLTISIAKDEGGFPGAVLATQTLAANATNFPTNGTNAGNLKTITFASPVLVTGAFHVVVGGFSGTATGGVRNVNITATDDRTVGKSTAYLYDVPYFGGWASTVEEMVGYLSLNIAPQFAYTTDIDAAFVAENGYTRQSNYGQFIPTNASIDFLDRTIGTPTEWNWTFTGASPATSNVANPQQITYASDGEFAVKLSVKNLPQTVDDEEIPDYVKVGYDTPEKIWNLLPGDAGDAGYYDAGYGPITGSNVTGDQSFAERFDAPLAMGYITSVDILFGNALSSGSLTVSIMKEVAGIPEQVLASKELPVSDINDGVYTTVTFDGPVYTDGAFYVVVSGFDQWTAGIAIYSSNALPASAKNTAFVFGPPAYAWNPILPAWGYSNSLSLSIVPTFTYSTLPAFSVVTDLAVGRKDFDATVGTGTVTSNIPWTATTAAPWITIVDGAGNSDGVFTYTVADNTDPYPRAARIIVAPTGLETLQQVIVVRQASTFPTDVTAAFVTDDVQVDWTGFPDNTLSKPLSSVAERKDFRKQVVISEENLPFTPDKFGSRTAVRAKDRSSLSDKKATLKGLADRVEPVAIAELAGQGENAPATEKRMLQSTPAAETEQNVPVQAKSTLQSTPAETVMRWDSGNNVNAIGVNNPLLTHFKMEVASLFKAGDFVVPDVPRGITYIKKIEVYINDLPVDGITLKIRQGSIVYSQPVSNAQLSIHSFNVITLNDAFLIDKNSDIYIGYEFHANGDNGGMFVAGMDEGPAVEGGDLISQDGGPLLSLYDISGGSLDGNWNIAAVIETGTVDYVVYRDDVAIAQTTAPTHLDTDQLYLSIGEHCYQVSALFDGLESTRSASACVMRASMLDLYEPSVTQEDFAAPGESQVITFTVTDPDDYINLLGLNFYANVPSWMTYSISGNAITFTASPNTTGFLRTGVIQVWLGVTGSTFSLANGYEIPVSQRSVLTPAMLNYLLTDVTYDGLPHGVSVALASPYTGLGNITVLYNGSPNVPVNAGDYTVSINTTAGVNFDPVTNLVLGSFKINPAPGTFVETDTINVGYPARLTLDDIPLPDGYEWVDPTTEIFPGDGQMFPAYYTDPSGNYAPVQGFIVVNVQEAIIPIPQRFVDLTNVPDDVTVNYVKVNGGEAIHNVGRNYVQGHEDFEFNATYAKGEPYVVEAYGDYSLKTVRLYPKQEGDGSFSYLIRQVVEPWTITFVTTEIESQITGTENIADVSVSTYNNVLTIVSDRTATADIYTMLGTRYKRLTVTEGTTREILPEGIYVVVINEKRFKVISK